MKVETIKKMLDTYEPETDLIVAWWDKETIEDYGASEMTNDQWEQVVNKYENGEWGWQSDAADTFVEIAGEVTEGYV